MVDRHESFLLLSPRSEAMKCGRNPGLATGVQNCPNRPRKRSSDRGQLDVSAADMDHWPTHALFGEEDDISAPQIPDGVPSTSETETATTRASS